jgi:hypothetical protein
VLNALTVSFIYDRNVRNGADGVQNIMAQITSALGGKPIAVMEIYFYRRYLPSVMLS